MKRSNDKVEGDSEKLGLKKGRYFNGLEVLSNATSGVFEGEEKRVSSENGAIGSVKAGNSYGGGLQVTDRWDFNRDYDLSLENGEKHRFDLNVSLYGCEMGLTEKLKHPLSEKRVEIIDISSDDSDSDNDVKLIGCSIVNEGNGKQIETGTHCDVMENLNLGLGLSEAHSFVAGSSFAAVSKRRYTREEKGKSIAIDPWLSLKTDYPNNLDFVPDRVIINLENDVTKLVEDDAEDRLDQPEALPELLLLRQAEPIMQTYADSVYRQSLREHAWRFARDDLPFKNSRAVLSNQKVTEKGVELLGSSSGPFSEALKRVRERTTKRAAAQLIEWTNAAENQHHNFTSPFVPSLLDLSVKALAENADRIVSLKLVPEFLRRRLTDMLCDARTINARFVNLLVEGCPTEIRIKNCSWLTDEQFQQSLGSWQTKNLSVLQLDLCGQCMFDLALRDKLARCSSSFSSLAILSLRGACRLSDSGLKTLVMSTPTLKSMNLGHCSLLTCDAITFIGDSLGSKLRELYIDDCQKVNAKLILPAIKKFTYLEVLSVAGIQTVTDQFVSELITVCGRSIKELDFANCLELTDLSLKAIGNNCSDLRSLNISHLSNLTNLGMEYLANGCRLIQKLNLSRCGFSDEAVAAFLETSGESLVELLMNSVAKVGPNTAFALANYSRKLVYLDISWCRIISNETLGLIVNNCPSMKLLKVFGCRQITEVFLNGQSNRLVQVIGLAFSPVQDHLNLLEPGEVFLRYSPLPNCTES